MTERPKLSLQFETRCQNDGARITVTVHIIASPHPLTDNRTPIGRRIKNCLFPAYIRAFGHKHVTIYDVFHRNLAQFARPSCQQHPRQRQSPPHLADASAHQPEMSFQVFQSGISYRFEIILDCCSGAEGESGPGWWVGRGRQDIFVTLILFQDPVRWRAISRGPETSSG